MFMNYADDGVKVGDIWYNKHYKGSYAIITEIEAGAGKNGMYYDYYYGPNDLGKCGDKARGFVTLFQLLDNFDPKSANFSKIYKLRKCIEKINKLVNC